MIKDLVFFPTVCRRISDGTLWEPSHPRTPVSLKLEWYFRQIVQVWGPIWRRTGTIWRLPDEKDNYRQFEIASWHHPRR